MNFKIFLLFSQSATLTLSLSNMIMRGASLHNLLRHSTVCFMDLKKLNFLNGGSILGLSQFLLLHQKPSKTTFAKKWSNWLENNQLATLIYIGETNCIKDLIYNDHTVKTKSWSNQRPFFWSQMTRLFLTSLVL
jgi:hypothetical protein